MNITETVQITRELHVAPCLQCASSNILLSDSNYSSHNIGGGQCKDCGAEAYGAVGINPSKDVLAQIWNETNDIPTLLRAQGDIVSAAKAQIRALKGKLRSAAAKYPQVVLAVEKMEEEDLLKHREAFVHKIKEEESHLDPWSKTSVKAHWSGKKHGFAEQRLQQRWLDFLAGRLYDVEPPTKGAAK